MKENRMVKRVWFVFFCLFSIFFLQAQEQNGANGEKVDVVYLTNGVVVRGHIVSSGDGEMVVRTLDGQTKRFALTEVESTSSELMQTKPEIKKNFYDPGFRGFVELGYGFDVNNTSDVFEFNFIGGHRFSKRFFLGLGIGYVHALSSGSSYYATGKKRSQGEWDLWSCFVDSHFYLGKIVPKTKHIFYLGARMGICGTDDYYKWFNFSLSANYQYRLKGRHSLNFSLAYSNGQGDYGIEEYCFRAGEGYFWRDRGLNRIQTISLRVSYGF